MPIGNKDSGWIQTYKGIPFYPLNPQIKDISIVDIAHALSFQCRFSGHCNEFYSVAEHSVRVSFECNSKNALWGLLHDAAEAYLVDLPRPIKHSGIFEAYSEAEEKLLSVIAKKFNLPNSIPKSVKVIDKILLSTEARDIMSSPSIPWSEIVKPLKEKIIPWSSLESKCKFFERFIDLTGG